MPLIPVDQVTVGERFRKYLGDIKGLAESIMEVGLLHPIVVSEDYQLIAGLRRLKAFKYLLRREIPATIVSVDDARKGEIVENTERKDFTCSEMVVVKRYLAPMIKKEIVVEKATGKLPEDSRDIIATYMGVSGRTLEKAEEIVEAAESDPEKYVGILEAVDNGDKSIHKGWSEIRKQRRREERREQIPGEWRPQIKSFLLANEWLRSLVDYPDRGPFGDGEFAGNASGWLLVQLINHYNPGSVFDPMEGSGTSRDVCEAMGIKYYGNDLKNPDGYDIIEAPNELLPTVDLTYFHPPYHNIIHYSDHPHDLSNQPTYADFLKLLYASIDKFLGKTKILAVLVGDIFDKETFQYWSIGGDIYERYKNRLIWRILKAQHSVSSGFADQALKQRNPHYIPLRHEDVYLLWGDRHD